MGDFRTNPPKGLWEDAWGRLRQNPLAMISLYVVLFIVVSGYCAPLLARFVTHFSPTESHTQLALMAPGARDISRDYPTYDGYAEWFDLIDLDGSGEIECTLERLENPKVPSLKALEKFEFPGREKKGGGPVTVTDQLMQSVQLETSGVVTLDTFLAVELGTYRCPELDRLKRAFRFFEFLMADYDVAPGMEAPGVAPRPDGMLNALEYPKTDSEISAEFRNLSLAGPESFAKLDLDGDGFVTAREIVDSTTYLRYDKEHLLAHYDHNRDLRIQRSEFPGAPQVRTFYAGTDGHGRDLLTRMLYGARISITIGLLATFVSFLIGVSYGAISGFFGGRVDAVMMRIVDILYGLPFMFVVILLIVFVGRSTLNLFIALGAVQWLTMSRVVRGQVLSLKTREFVEAAEAIGVSSMGIIFRHLLRNTVGPVIIYSTLMVPAIIKEEAFLSFLGLGVQPPDPSWGNLITEGAARIEDYWWLAVYPGLALAVTLFSMNFLGDGVRDALDPRQSLERT